MPNLADSLQRATFVTKLETCERRWNHLSDWERGFVSDLREKFEERDTMVDLGVTAWNPSANQSNTLSEIYEKVR